MLSSRPQWTGNYSTPQEYGQLLKTMEIMRHEEQLEGTVFNLGEKILTEASLKSE